MAASASASASWSELPRDLRGAVIDRVDLAADIARLRTVCRCWHSVVREHAPSRGRRPRRIILPTGFPDGNKTGGGFYVLPKKARCVGSTGSWLALAIYNTKSSHHEDQDEPRSRRSYYMYNPYSATTVPLPELDAVIGNAYKLFEVRKVLMRSSTPDDLIALLTNNYNYPIILVRPGKGVWLPKPQEVPYVYLIDIAFLGDDKLYGITQAEDLVAITLSFPAGAPLVTGVERVIKHLHLGPTGDSSSNAWSDVDVKRVIVSRQLLPEEEEDYNNAELATYELMKKTGDDMILEAMDYRTNSDFPSDIARITTTAWFLVESCGKLLMVRRKLEGFMEIRTRIIDVFEADVTAGIWVPVVDDGLSNNSHTLFISRCSSKLVSASEETAVGRGF